MMQTTSMAGQCINHFHTLTKNDQINGKFKRETGKGLIL